MNVLIERHKQTLLLLLLFSILLLPSGLCPLVESTEARYAEIGREMVASGNYLEPHLNGIKHFHKPPLAYWLIAAGISLFGANDFGARFFGVLAAAIAVLYLYRLALVVLEDNKKAWYAALIFASSPLFLAVSRIVSTDIYLTCFTIQAQYHLARCVYGKKRGQDVFFYALFLGLGFLTKGPIIFLFTLLPYFVAKIFDQGHRSVFSRKEVAAGLAVFVGITLPWYLAVVIKNPGLLYYFLKVQTIDRVATDRFRRHQPIWYFFYIFFATFAPYILFLGRGLFCFRLLPQRVRVLTVYVIVPFLVFSLAESKLPTYIVPLYGIAAIISAEVFATLAMSRLRAVILALLGLLTIAPLAAGFGYPLLKDLWFLMVGATLITGGLFWWTYQVRGQENFLLRTAIVLVFIGTVGYIAFGSIAHQRRGFERLVAKINLLDPDRQKQVLVYQDLLPSVSFYRGALAIMSLGKERETQFEKGNTHEIYNLDYKDKLEQFLLQEKSLFVIANPERIKEFTAQYPLTCEEVFRQENRAAYLCEGK